MLRRLLRLWQSVVVFFVAGWCAATDHHGTEKKIIGDMVKPGWRSVPITQCQRCAFMGIVGSDVQRFGGKTR